MQQQLDDNEVIQLVLQGQQSAYAILVERYQQYVFTLVLRFVNSRELAEELAQDVFVKAYRCLADYKGNSKFSTWLYTIVNTTCLSHLRKRKDETIFLEDDKMAALASHFGHDEKPLQVMEQKAQKQLIEKAMAYLPQTDNQMLSLFYLAEQSVDEIGNIMGLNTSNVKVRLFRARQKLKEILGSKFSSEALELKY